jgi:nicotinamide riboside transporter PnuC
MGILELIVVLVTIAGLFIWNRTESRADTRHMDQKIDAIRELVHAIHLETKEFHSRLASIEEKRK